MYINSFLGEKINPHVYSGIPIKDGQGYREMSDLLFPGFCIKPYILDAKM